MFYLSHEALLKILQMSYKIRRSVQFSAPHILYSAQNKTSINNFKKKRIFWLIQYHFPPYKTNYSLFAMEIGQS